MQITVLCSFIILCYRSLLVAAIAIGYGRQAVEWKGGGLAELTPRGMDVSQFPCGITARYSTLEWQLTDKAPPPDGQIRPLLATRVSPANLNNTVRYQYRIPGQPSLVRMDFDTDSRLQPSAAYMLLSQSMHDVGLTLHFGGNRPVPGQKYTREAFGPQGQHVHFGVWPLFDEPQTDELTYQFVMDTLVGLWEFIVKRKMALECEVRLYHGTLGFVALGWVQDGDIDASALKRPVKEA
ncbi:MAG: hypothetical protein Q9182_004119 [Xanthomendoza sp. 2 TL-2023]